MKYGRRGSLTGRLKIIGKQGHVAYPDQADNPIHSYAPIAHELCGQHWDNGDEKLPAQRLPKWSAVHAGIGRDNVTPGELEAVFNLRYSPALNEQAIRQRVERLLARHQLNHKLRWHLAGQPFLSKKGALNKALREAIQRHTGQTPPLSTSGGTSDGRFIIASGAELAEFGPVNSSIHQVDEHVRIADLQPLSEIYGDVAEKCLLNR